MNIPEEIDRIKAAIKTVEDPGAAMALRHVCKALSELSGQIDTGRGNVEEEERQTPQ